ncbi:MAG: SprT-like domain-containing protein [Prevotella sp.]|nr:SprT-like domain-containing protein [Prevotella sp.]
MKINSEWMRRQFAQFNRDYFGNGLPEPRLSTSKARTRLGTFSCKKRRKLLRTELYDFAIRLSTYYEQTERDYQNTLLHEMIHYSIAYTGLKDTSPHGVVFRGIMDNLNRKYGWEISVTGKKTAVERPRTMSRSLLLALITHDNRRMLTIVNPRYARSLDARLKRHSEVKSYRWYTTTNSFFLDFSKVRSLRGRLVSLADFARLTDDAIPVSLLP